ncbi:MAG: HIT domain-containing protein [Planctomycetaceae bacterium]|jgi:ATP adenylyltransferase|nr:HIT domain-containing protein [Planctomycetaceae bacterium]
MTKQIETLWAPWRMAYINEDDEAKKTRKELQNVEVGPNADPECFLCQAVFDETRDRQRLVVRRDALTITVLNRFPYNNGHVLIAPRCHCGVLHGLTLAEKTALLQEIDRMTALLEKIMTPDGFNIGLNMGQSAGAGLPGHLHWHIVPRWNGDINYMTTIGSAKVIPQSLEALWELLVE